MPDTAVKDKVSITGIPEHRFDKMDEEGVAPINFQKQMEVIKQVSEEYKISYDYMEPKLVVWRKRLKLYNNQKRDQSKVGDPLLFTVFNTVLAALWGDRLAARAEAVEEGDEERAENVNAVMAYDYNLMKKDQLDYDWDWNTAFFGRALVLMAEYDRKRMVPVPEVLDMLSWVRDPRANSINGNMAGHGAMRFGGMEIGLTKSELEAHPSYFNLEALKKEKDLMKGLLALSKKSHSEAQGLQKNEYKEETLDENYEYTLLNWFTVIGGVKYLIVFGNRGKLVIRYEKILNQDEWPIQDRSIFPMANDWDGVSIPDLIEDKQRARAVMINLGMESALATLYSRYLFDKNRIVNPRDLDMEQNKYIPVKGVRGQPISNALHPIQNSTIHNEVNLILNILDVAAQKSVAAPEVAQGVQPKQDRTLGETELIMAGKSVRHSMAIRIFGFSEEGFWRKYYWLHKRFFKATLDRKAIRIQGPLGPAWRKYAPEDLFGGADPDIIIESATIVEGARQKEFNDLFSLAQLAIQDPDTNRRFLFRKLGRLKNMTTQELTLLFPPNFDELHAEDENKIIDENKLPKVSPHDDDIIHLEIHNRAADVPAKMAHIQAHKEMMMFKKANPELFPQEMPIEFKPVSGPRGPQASGQKESVRQEAPLEREAEIA